MNHERFGNCSEDCLKYLSSNSHKIRYLEINVYGCMNIIAGPYLRI